MTFDNNKEIRLYTDEQVVDGVDELFSQKSFVAGMQAFLPFELSESFLKVYPRIRSSYDFQSHIIRPLLKHLEKVSMSSLSGSGLDQLDRNQKYLFISNHRDIGLDSAYVNLLLYEADFTTAQIAIGDNLMKHRIAELIFRINKSFVVRRSGPPRDLYNSLSALSSYIHKTISDSIDSVWIAQRQGRAKDGNDFTQVSLIKMLGLTAEKDLVAHLSNFNIVPVSISYEYDPCDYLKTKEFIDKKNNPDYQKSFASDMGAILQGMKGKKGNVHLSFGTPLNEQIKELSEDLKTKEVLEKVASIIDQQILASYKLNPINYIAADLLRDDSSLSENYTKEEKALVENNFEKILSKIDNADVEEAKAYLLGMYANPYFNKITNSKFSK